MADPVPMLPPPPKPVRLATLLLAILLGGSCVLGLWLAVFGAPAVVLGMLGFEAVVLTAAIFGVFAGLGWYREGWALALACVAGCVLAGSVLGFIDGRANFTTTPGLSRALEVLVLARVSSAGLLGGLATLAVLARDPRSWRHVAISLALALPVLVVLALAATVARPWLSNGQEGVMEVVRIVVLVVGGLAMAVVFSVAVHHLIRAYQLGSPDYNTNKVSV